MVELTGKQRRYLRGLGHHLDPVVHIGQAGVSDGVVRATAEALVTHELIKVKVPGDSRQERRELAEALATATTSHLVQSVGKVILLYKERDEEPEITLPG